MTAKGVAYIVAAVVLGVFVLANWSLFTTFAELNFLVARVQGPLILLMLVVAGVILLVDLAVHALGQRAWVRERRALRKDLESALLRADHEEESRVGTLRVTLERELAAIRAQLDQVLAGQSALLGRPPSARTDDPRAVEPRAVEPRAGRRQLELPGALPQVKSY
jgi:uncharacterized integral membrane protein